MRFFRWQKALLPLAALLLLPSCVAGLNAVEIQQISDEQSVELILEPIDVWNDEAALEAEALTVAGEEMYFRPSDIDTFDRAWVRVGLFWHSRLERVYMPIVIAGGPPVELKAARMDIDKNSETLKTVKNFNFTPGKRPFDKELHSAVFSVSPKSLAKIAASEDVYLTISTSRGALRVNLSVVSGRGENTLAASAKYQFTEFYRRMQEHS